MISAEFRVGVATNVSVHDKEIGPLPAFVRSFAPLQMNPGGWQQTEDPLLELQRTSVKSSSTRLARALRHEVESLIQAEDREERFIE